MILSNIQILQLAKECSRWIVQERGAVFPRLSRDPEVKLTPHQLQHVKNIEELLKRKRVVMDSSAMGSGKTFTTLELAARRGVKHMVVVCPSPTSKTEWKNRAKQFGVRVAVVTYNQLTNSGGNGLLHSYPEDDPKKQPSDKNFEPTQAFTKMATKGIVLVVDEVQCTKNGSQRHSAVAALTRQINDASHSKSCALLLSATPIDKKRQTLHMCEILGIVTECRLAKHHDEENVAWEDIINDEAIQQLSEYCRKYVSREKTEATIDSVRQSSRLRLAWQRNWEIEAKYELSFELFQKLVLPAHRREMVSTETTQLIKCTNRCCFVTDEDHRKLLTLTDELKKCRPPYDKNLFYVERQRGPNGEHRQRQIPTEQEVTADDREGQQEWPPEDGSSVGISRPLRLIEERKTEAFIRNVRAALLQNEPRVKVVVAMNYLASVERLREEFKEYDPLVCTGEVKGKDKDSVLEKFQEASFDHRLLIGTVEVLSTGIDLDDKDGNLPRVALVSPSFNIVSLYQFSRRFGRQNTKSSTSVHFIYTKAEIENTSLFQRIREKGEVLKAVGGEQ